MRAVLCAALAATLSIGASATANAQAASQAQAPDSVKLAAIHQLLTLTHGIDLAFSAMETSIPSQRLVNTRIPAVFWDRFLTEVRNRRPEFESLMVDVYAHHFTTDELRQLIAFYQTPIGQKMVQEQPAVLQESMQAGRQFGSRIGSMVASQLQSEGVQVGP